MTVGGANARADSLRCGDLENVREQMRRNHLGQDERVAAPCARVVEPFDALEFRVAAEIDLADGFGNVVDHDELGLRVVGKLQAFEHSFDVVRGPD